MRLARGRMAGLGIAAAVVWAVGACGGDDSPSPEAAERPALVRAVKGLQRAFEAGDRRGLCRRMSKAARLQAGVVAHGQPGRCVEDLGEAFSVVDPAGMRGMAGSRVGPVAVNGREATVMLALRGQGRVAVPFEREGGDWRLATFFGTPEASVRKAVQADRSAPFPPASGPVRVADAAGPCLPLFSGAYPQVGGGCELHASARRITLTIGTVFGRFTFGECNLLYRVVVDAQGRAWTDSVEFAGPGNVNNGCSDVSSCEGAGAPLPWKGRVSAAPDGRLAHRMNVCLSTCIGHYSGPLTVSLSKRGTWRAVAVDAAAGRSGLRFDGEAVLGGAGVAMAPRG